MGRKKKNKLKFSHFERYSIEKGKYGYDYTKKDGVKSNSIQIYAGNFGGEEVEDLEIELTIKDGDIEMTLISQNCEDWEIEAFDDMKKYIDWDGFEFMEFFDIRDKSIKITPTQNRVPFNWRLIATDDSENSEMFDILTSDKNMQNLNNMSNTLNKFI